MRYRIIILILIIASCKSETKVSNEINASVSNMWSNYINSHPDFKNNEVPESWYFHDNKYDADRLADLTLSGKKQAASGLYAWYKNANANLPIVGKKHIITDFNGHAQAIIEIVKVDTIPFNKITIEYAELDMGTQIEPLKQWKKAHREFFTSTLDKTNDKPLEDMLVVCEWFKKIWPVQNSQKLYD
ncbi:ASCH domain-containing protein [Winogradskyella sp. PE311]|uniref:ASCH domain-containing protein n=1 Tax=Winogradskyella sp. PE311 TaxID=3366943 RepID=UPI00397FEED4